jgi:prepilin-type N-terminal cleavage/methylation domain-containing protein
MRNQRGVTLIELVVVAAIASLVVTIIAMYSAPWIARESMRSAVNNVASFLQLAKIEAVSRNRDCRFVVDTSDGSLEVWDSMGSDDLSDDVRLHTGSVPTSVRFQRPDTGGVVTLQPIGGTPRFQTRFASDGLVPAGVGAVFLEGGEGFGKVEVHAAGGVEVHFWKRSAWRTGS